MSEKPSSHLYIAVDNVIRHDGSGGEPPGGDQLEARVRKLEDDMKEIKGDLKTLLKDSSEVKGRLAGMPSTWQIVGIVGAMLALVIAGGGSLLTVLRFVQPPV